jgi:hypothetical protein
MDDILARVKGGGILNNILYGNQESPKEEPFDNNVA